MPDEYDAIRRNMSNYEKGLYFELGRAHERGETPEKGWVRQFEIRTSEGPRVLDSARTEGRGIRSVERKSGRVNERDAHEQLKKSVPDSRPDSWCEAIGKRSLVKRSPNRHAKICRRWPAIFPAGSIMR